MGQVFRDPTPGWMKPPEPETRVEPVGEFGGLRSVVETPKESGRMRLARTLANLIGADSPTSQVMMLMNPLAAGPEGGLVGAVQRVLKPIKAYHGSPHDFPAEPGAPLGRFRSENIGTGEGAQAYGHGLYFAERPETAQGYRAALSSSNQTDIRMKSLIDKHGSLEPAMDEFMRSVYDTPKAKEKMRAMLSEQWSQKPPTGRTYEVNIHADPEDFLDWDKPLSQQSERVREAVRSEVGDQSGMVTDADRAARYVSGSDDPTGAAAIQLIEDRAYQADPVGAAYDIGAAERMLKSRGIPGIKYLDQGSRAGAGGELMAVFEKDGKWFSRVRGIDRNMFTTSAPQATREAAETWASDTIAKQVTRNYVVFDDSLIEILKKYGVALPVIEGLRQQAAENNGAVDLTGVL